MPKDLGSLQNHLRTIIAVRAVNRDLCRTTGAGSSSSSDDPSDDESSDEVRRTSSGKNKLYTNGFEGDGDFLRRAATAPNTREIDAHI